MSRPPPPSLPVTASDPQWLFSMMLSTENRIVTLRPKRVVKEHLSGKAAYLAIITQQNHPLFSLQVGHELLGGDPLILRLHEAQHLRATGLIEVLDNDCLRVELHNEPSSK